MPMDIEKNIAMIALQEERLRFTVFDEDMAWNLGSLLRTKANERGAAVVIEIRLGRETVFFTAMQGTAPVNADWARRKRNTVDLLNRSSYSIGLALRQEQSSLESKMGLPTRDFASHGGSFPISVTSVGCIGTVTVSGLPQREDHAIVVQALAEMCGVPITTIALD